MTGEGWPPYGPPAAQGDGRNMLRPYGLRWGGGTMGREGGLKPFGAWAV